MDKALERAIDRELEQIGTAVEALDHDEVDVEYQSGLLRIACGDTQLVLSRQSATGQLWLAEPAGGWHFDLKDGLWICDKRGVELTDALQQALSLALGQAVKLGT